ncbi:hypothetical protein F183_A21860 [Bryobacterales bacterium F-183]|nr:hypothetical protein F183_A21860 [Bryobacterales bacterium F-183]
MFFLCQAAAASALLYANTAPAPQYFEPNQGQFAPDIRYVARHGRHTLLVGHKGTVSLLDGKTRVRMTLAGTNGASMVKGLDTVPGVSNYLSDATSVTSVPHFARVLLRDVYPSTDLLFYFDAKGQLEYDFVVRPGAGVQSIRMQFEGATPKVQADGSLAFHTPQGLLRQLAPRVYQRDAQGRQIAVTANYKASGATVGFEVANYDRTKDLVIDPPITYLTYMGGTGRDAIGGVLTDGTGSMYLYGQGTSGLPQVNAFSSTAGTFVSKFNASGQLVFSTYLGFSVAPAAGAVDTSGQVFIAFERDGTGASRIVKLNAQGSGLLYNTTGTGATDLIPRSAATDSSGNNYFCGSIPAGTTGALPTTSGSLHPTKPSGDGLGFLMKLTSAGQVSYATYLPLQCAFVAVDSSGNAFVNGGVGLPFTTWTTTATFGTQPLNQTQFAEVVAKINPTGSTLIYASHFRSMNARGLAVDPLSDAVYVAGNASGAVGLVNPLRSTLANTEVYIAKLNGSGTSLIWGTLAGGNNRDDVSGIAVDPSSGTVAFVADTLSTDIAAVNAVQSTSQRTSGCFTGLVGQINSAGTQLLFQSYYGGAACVRTDITGYGKGYIAADNGAFYIGGEVQSASSPALTTVNGVQTTYGGGTADTFAAKFGTTTPPTCSYSLGSTSTTVAAAGGNISVSVTTQAGCTFSASTSSNFITISSGSPGSGSGNVGLSIAANSGAARSGAVLIAGQTFTVNQSAVAAPVLSTVSPNPSTAGTLTYTLTGTGFDPSSARVEINGSTIIDNASLTSKSATQLVFQATLIAGTNTFLVRNVTSGLTSNSVNVTTLTPTIVTGSHFIPIAPCRAADTRVSPGTPIPGGTFRNFTFGACAIPSNATAVALNVTLVPGGPFGFLSIWPAGQQQPVVSTMNSLDGRIKANAAIVGVGAGQAVSVFATDAAHVILDVNGYFVPAGTPGALAFYPVTPCRLLDTRGAGQGGVIPGQGTRRIDGSTSTNCLPAAAQAYSLNVTTLPTGTLGFLTLFPDDGSPRPTVSTLNNLTGTIVANSAILRAGNGGAFNAFVTDQTHLLADLNGYFAAPGQPGALAFFPVQPCRIFDTRLSAGPFGGPIMAADQTRNFTVPSSSCNVPSTAQAYVTNSTVIPNGFFGFLTLFAAGQSRPTVSTLNAIDGALTSNAAIVPAGTGGAISVYTSSSANLLMDISGYFAPLVTNN